MSTKSSEVLLSLEDICKYFKVSAAHLWGGRGRRGGGRRGAARGRGGFLRGQLLVNLHESTLSQKVAVVLDLEGLGVQQADLLNEEAVRIACTLCVRLLEAGIKVSAYSNGLDVHSGQPMALPA